MRYVFILLAFLGSYVSVQAQNVGIGVVNPLVKLHIEPNTAIRLGEGFISSGGPFLHLSNNNWYNGSAWSANLVNRQGVMLQMNAGDLNFYTSSAGVGVPTFQFNMIVRSDGNVGIGNTAPNTKFYVAGKTTLSRDTITECCGNNATLALAERTIVSGRTASISFHNSGSTEATLRLINDIGTGLGTGVIVDRLEAFRASGSPLSLRVTGGLYYGLSDSRTETRANAGLQGNAGAQSGFYEYNQTAGNSQDFNYPGGYAGNTWWHLMDVRHSNPANNYAMQLAGNFFDQDMYVRKTNNNASSAWARVQTSRDIVFSKSEYRGVFGPSGTGVPGAAGWINVTENYTGYMNVRVGDQIKLDGMYYGRLTGGNDNEYFYTRVFINGTDGCGDYTSNRHDYWHVTEAGNDHDNFKPVPYMDVWTSPCNGRIRFLLQVYMRGDDNWETRENIVIATRY
jgi:hypothetical protein